MLDNRNTPEKTGAEQASSPAVKRMSSFVQQIQSDNGVTRCRARHALVAAGETATDALIQLLEDKRFEVRWEAAKALGEIADPSSAPQLVKALEDDAISVRWLAAEALVSLGSGGVKPLLKALTDPNHSIWLLQGAHHVFHELFRGTRPEEFEPVMAALEQVEPQLTVPWAAAEALRKMEEHGK
jgi:HEAT repeat protein